MLDRGEVCDAVDSTCLTNERFVMRETLYA